MKYIKRANLGPEERWGPSICSCLGPKWPLKLLAYFNPCIQMIITRTLRNKFNCSITYFCPNSFQNQNCAFIKTFDLRWKKEYRESNEKWATFLLDLSGVVPNLYQTKNFGKSIPLLWGRGELGASYPSVILAAMAFKSLHPHSWAQSHYTPPCPCTHISATADFISITFYSWSTFLPIGNIRPVQCLQTRVGIRRALRQILNSKNCEVLKIVQRAQWPLKDLAVFNLWYMKYIRSANLGPEKKKKKKKDEGPQIVHAWGLNGPWNFWLILTPAYKW